MSSQMTALFGGDGPDWTVEKIDVPAPGPGEVVVRAGAVALNNADAAMLAAADPATGTGERYRAGFEFAGEVTAVGDGTGGVGVGGVGIGDRVMGTTPESFAEYVVADHRHVTRIPDAVDVAVAAALPTGALTEHGALRVAGFGHGDSVLITAATSGVGMIGVQIARHLGAGTIVATTRSAAKADLLTGLGADVVVDTSTQDLTRAVLDATGGRGVDVVLDHVGGATFAACLPATAVDGTVVCIGRLDTATSAIDLDALAYRHLAVRGVSFGFTRPAELGDVIAGLGDAVLPAVADGTIRPVVDRTFPFDQAGLALERLRSGEAAGKIVLTIG